jgi:hypothetical protein
VPVAGPDSGSNQARANGFRACAVKWARRRLKQSGEIEHLDVAGGRLELPGRTSPGRHGAVRRFPHGEQGNGPGGSLLPLSGRQNRPISGENGMQIAPDRIFNDAEGRHGMMLLAGAP